MAGIRSHTLYSLSPASSSPAILAGTQPPIALAALRIPSHTLSGTKFSYLAMYLLSSGFVDNAVSISK